MRFENPSHEWVLRWLLIQEGGKSTLRELHRIATSVTKEDLEELVKAGLLRIGGKKNIQSGYEILESQNAIELTDEGRRKFV